VAVSRDGVTLYVIETDENRLLRFKIVRRDTCRSTTFLNMDELTITSVISTPTV